MAVARPAPRGTFSPFISGSRSGLLPPRSRFTMHDDEQTPIRNEIASILSARTKEGMIEFQINDQKVQMDLPKAREVRGMLDGAIEAAVSDTLIFKFLTSKIGLPEAAAARALLDFRELRQGSKGTVYPQ